MLIPKSNSDLIKDSKLNPYELSIILEKRVTELIHGAKPLVDSGKHNLVEISVLELLSGKIRPNISE